MDRSFVLKGQNVQGEELLLTAMRELDEGDVGVSRLVSVSVVYAKVLVVVLCECIRVQPALSFIDPHLRL